jgi:hypothetical protein
MSYWLLIVLDCMLIFIVWVNSGLFGVGLTMLWGCHLLGKLGSAKHHPQKKTFSALSGAIGFCSMPLFSVFMLIGSLRFLPSCQAALYFGK